MAIYEYDGQRPEIDSTAYVHEQATLIGQVKLAAGASIWPQAVLRADNEPILIGTGSNVQDGAVLHTDPGFPLEVGEGVTIGHQAMLHGCSVGETPDRYSGRGIERRQNRQKLSGRCRCAGH